MLQISCEGITWVSKGLNSARNPLFSIKYGMLKPILRHVQL